MPASMNSIKISDLRLDHVPPGRWVVIKGFANLKPDQETHLQAYGLLPGRLVRVLQHLPETIVQIEHTELAFEQSIASQVVVQLR